MKVAAALALFIAVVAAQTQRIAPRNIVVFGDSLSDDGGLLYASTYAAFDYRPKWGPVWSDGPGWTTHITDLFNQSFSYVPNIVNYAIAGSPSDSVYLTDMLNTTGILPGMVQQHTMYRLNQIPQTDLCGKLPAINSETLYVLMSGGNDGLLALAQGLQPNVNKIVESYTNVTKALQAAGATQIAWVSMFAFETTPYIIGAQMTDNVRQLTTGVNYLLRNGAAQLNATYVNTYDLTRNVAENYTTMGFTTYGPCLTTSTSGGSTTYTANCAGKNVFVDTIHPATEVHQLFAQEIFKSLNYTTAPILPNEKLGVPAAPTTGVENIVVFGDSLSDYDNLRFVMPSVAYDYRPKWGGSFSNGPTWVKYVVDNVRKSYNYTPNVYNYAIASAVTDSVWMASYLNKTIYVPGLAQQLDRYLAGTAPWSYRCASAAPAVSSKSVYVIWGGGNDVLQSVEAGKSPTPAVQNVIAVYTNMTARLIARGATKFIWVTTLAGHTSPYGQSQSVLVQATLQDLATYTRHYLNAGAKSVVSKYAGVSVQYVDPYDLSVTFLNNSASYNFTKYGPCTTGSSPTWTVSCSSTVSAAWFDGVHPSTGAHALIADLFKNVTFWSTSSGNNASNPANSVTASIWLVAALVSAVVILPSKLL